MGFTQDLVHEIVFSMYLNLDFLIRNTCLFSRFKIAITKQVQRNKKKSSEVSNTVLNLASASNSICQQQQRIKTPSVTPIIQWPGIEAVIESYKKYSQGNYYNTQISFLIPYCTVV